MYPLKIILGLVLSFGGLESFSQSFNDLVGAETIASLRKVREMLADEKPCDLLWGTLLDLFRSYSESGRSPANLVQREKFKLLRKAGPEKIVISGGWNEMYWRALQPFSSLDSDTNKKTFTFGKAAFYDILGFLNHFYKSPDPFVNVPNLGDLLSQFSWIDAENQHVQTLLVRMAADPWFRIGAHRELVLGQWRANGLSAAIRPYLALVEERPIAPNDRLIFPFAGSDFGQKIRALLGRHPLEDLRKKGADLTADLIMILLRGQDFGPDWERDFMDLKALGILDFSKVEPWWIFLAIDRHSPWEQPIVNIARLFALGLNFEQEHEGMTLFEKVGMMAMDELSSPLYTAFFQTPFAPEVVEAHRTFLEDFVANILIKSEQNGTGYLQRVSYQKFATTNHLRLNIFERVQKQKTVTLSHPAVFEQIIEENGDLSKLPLVVQGEMFAKVHLHNDTCVNTFVAFLKGHGKDGKGLLLLDPFDTMYNLICKNTDVAGAMQCIRLLGYGIKDFQRTKFDESLFDFALESGVTDPELLRFLVANGTPLFRFLATATDRNAEKFAEFMHAYDLRDLVTDARQAQEAMTRQDQVFHRWALKKMGIKEKDLFLLIQSFLFSAELVTWLYKNLVFYDFHSIKDLEVLSEELGLWEIQSALRMCQKIEGGDDHDL